MWRWHESHKALKENFFSGLNFSAGSAYCANEKESWCLVFEEVLRGDGRLSRKPSAFKDSTSFLGHTFPCTNSHQNKKKVHCQLPRSEGLLRFSVLKKLLSCHDLLGSCQCLKRYAGKCAWTCPCSEAALAWVLTESQFYSSFLKKAKSARKKIGVHVKLEFCPRCQLGLCQQCVLQRI